MSKTVGDVKEVFNEDELIHMFKDIIKIPSENPGNFEEGVVKKIQEILDKEGISSYLRYVDNKRPNLYAILEGPEEGKTLLYNGHTDTVPISEVWDYGPFSAHEDEEGYIYGRGTSDMKAGVVSMLYAAICLKRLDYPKKGKLILLFNADEEVINLGMKQFLEEDITADFAIISEPTELDVAIGHRGVSRYYVTTEGTAGHACYVSRPNNAIEKMHKLLTPVFKWGEEIKKQKTNDFLGSALSNITTIKGGIAGNIIPDKCVAEIDRRLLPGELKEEVLIEYQKIFSSNDDGIDYKIENYTFLPASLIDKEHSFVKSVNGVVQKYKEDVQIKSFEATCEAPFFSVDKKIPTIIFGPGSLKQAHVKNERVHKSEVLIAGKAFVEICRILLSD